MDNRADRFRALMVFVGTIALVVCAAFLVGMLTMGRPVDVCPMPEDALGTFVRVEGGGFIKGADGVYPEEGQPKKLYVSPFLIQVHEVTNDQFSAFVAATGYITEAEEGGGSAQFVPTTTPENLSSWWRLDGGVTWRTPNG
ncbi:MAG: SUMF1/EgtB/PvdO family nonheme iron enzyme, partial [Myxococcota bacterium]